MYLFLNTYFFHTLWKVPDPHASPVNNPGFRPATLFLLMSPLSPKNSSGLLTRSLK